MAVAQTAKRKGLRSLRDQAPADWECWAIDADDVDIIVHIPDCCLSTGRIVKQIIRMPVTVKIGRSH